MQEIADEKTFDATPETWSQADEALEGHLAPDEAVLLTAGALQRMRLQFFDRCELVLTDRNLIILKPSWPWGFRFDRAIPRSGCSIHRHKPRMDGSHLLVLRTAEGEDICFYIPRRSRDAGVAIMEELG